ncbi:hypothetical protein LSTR_LSTR011321 [Laodelphax striatellus]|uniref:DUF4794 domain-containing protein n=1 Tax=Laodelphax striatellus TaxID=195883 RepID=A0A482WGX1_LAOST|nr:hypothetical protein LSTR_LSTR011321 [Laodelphax striatellus]
MKISCTTLAVLATCLACGFAEVPVGDQDGAPYPASGWKPAGRLLLLPIRQQESPANEYGPPEQISATEYPPVTPQTEESKNASAFPASQQLQQQPGVNSGVYHVLLPDGRLQRVEFTTAPLKSEAAQSFTSPLQYQQEQAVNSDYSFSGQYQQQPQEQLVSYEVQKSQNYELAPTQPFAFPGAFPNAFPQTSEGQSAKFTQGQTAGQAGFQKPSFQQNQFGLNTFEQTQTQQNQFGQSSFQQSPRGGKFSQPQTGFSQSSNAKFQQQQQRQYLSPRPNIESQSSFSQYKVSQTNAAAPSGSNGKYTSGQQQQYQPQAQPQVFGYQQVYFTQSQQSEQSDAETVPTPPEGTAYVANVQYKDVEPIPGPIYSYNPAPLVRILRKTE